MLEARQEAVFPRVPTRLEFESEPPRRSEASIFELLSAVNSVLQRFGQRPDQRDIFEDKFSVSEKIELLLKSISERGRLRFSNLFQDVTSRSEVVVTFLALLELIRLKQLVAVQSEPFGEIEICRAESQPAEDPAPEAEAVMAASPASETSTGSPPPESQN